MDLESISNLAVGAALVGGLTAVAVTYLVCRISSSVDKVRRDTTNLLNAFTEYIAPRLLEPEDINSMKELVGTRVKYGL